MHEEGQPILGFDTEALNRQLVDKQAELAEFTKKVEQKETDLRFKLMELEQQVAQARPTWARRSSRPKCLPTCSAASSRKARLDYKGRQRDLENLQAEQRAARSLAEAELRSLANQRDRARGRVEALQAAIEKMTVKAPQDGIVVYRTNWRDEKEKVGDSMWFGEIVLGLPDLSEMRADGLVDEADGGVAARPEGHDPPGGPPRPRCVRARAHSGAHRAPESWRNPVKVYKVDIALDHTDAGVMRPAMRFRGEIETGRTPGLLLAPRDAVFLRERSGRVGAPRPGLARGARAAQAEQPAPGGDRVRPEGGRAPQPEGPRHRGPAAPRRPPEAAR